MAYRIGRRRRDRPRKRWRDDLDSFVRYWPKKATTREERKAMS